MGSKNIGILNHGFGIRIDFPRDNFWKARLHQDYTSQLGSPNGIVIYSAFDSVSKKQGPVILYKGSHNPGIFKTLTNYKKVKQKKTYDPYYIDIKKYELKRFKKFHLVLRERDMALFDFRMLHESGNNFSNKIRWSAIHRIFDLSHKDAIKNFFKGGMKESVLFKNKKIIVNKDKFILEINSAGRFSMSPWKSKFYEIKNIKKKMFPIGLI